MLVLSRRKEESIVIDGQIEIEVLKVSGNTVRLGIKAPRNIKVLRGELAPFGKPASAKNDAIAVVEVDHHTVGFSTPIANAG